MSGTGSGALITAALEIVLICRACDARMAINAVVSEHACERCGARVPLSVDRWRQLLGDVMHDAARMVENDDIRRRLSDESDSWG